LDKVTGPLGPRRGIATALKQLREDSGKHLNAVAGDLMISTSKLSRLENAQGKPLPRDIRDLISYYGIDGTPLADKLRRWVAAAQRQGWWTDFDDQVLGGLDAHLAYEVDARSSLLLSAK
jgi:transcriptional regulator with XRE-family HTH domain